MNFNLIQCMGPSVESELDAKLDLGCMDPSGVK